MKPALPAKFSLLMAVVALAFTLTASARACTIFVLTDGTRTLFFNNEDWFNSATRLWFVPAGKDHLGCAFVGFDNGWAQGGVNSAGLAFDWVSGFDEPYTPDPILRPVRGNPSERMLETCTTVDEAIAFYRAHLETDFKRSRLLVADRTGASVVIGAKNGRLHFARMNASRGFGYARTTVERELGQSPPPTLARGAAILRACLQPGDGGTKYSNAYDLNTGEITVFPFPGRDESVTLDLAGEFAKGPHYYDLPQLREQHAAAPRPLLPSMQRFYLDTFSPIPDSDPAFTARLAAIIRSAAAGAWRESDFTPALWHRISPALKEIQSELQSLGALTAVSLVERSDQSDARSYRYLLDFERARVLGRYVVAAENRIDLMQSEFAEQKSPHPTPAL